jgi:hypothetical protein
MRILAVHSMMNRGKAMPPDAIQRMINGEAGRLFIARRLGTDQLVRFDPDKPVFRDENSVRMQM